MFIIIINRRLHGRFKIRNFSFRALTREIFFNTRRLKFRTYEGPRVILRVISFFFFFWPKFRNFGYRSQSGHKSLAPWKSIVNLSSLSRMEKSKIDSFFWTLKKSLKWYLENVPLKKFGLNGHTRGFYPETKTLDWHTKPTVPCQSTIELQIWVVMRHQYGISTLVSQTSFGGKTSGSVSKCWLFSQATTGSKVRTTY